jgi:hypothetical protein
MGALSRPRNYQWECLPCCVTQMWLLAAGFFIAQEQLEDAARCLERA